MFCFGLHSKGSISGQLPNDVRLPTRPGLGIYTHVLKEKNLRGLHAFPGDAKPREEEILPNISQVWQGIMVSIMGASMGSHLGKLVVLRQGGAEGP